MISKTRIMDIKLSPRLKIEAHQNRGAPLAAGAVVLAPTHVVYLFLMLRGSAHWPVLGQCAGEPRLDHVPIKSQDIHDSNQIDTGTCRVKNREWETHAGATQAAIAQQQGQARHGHELGKKAGRVWFPVTTSCSTAEVFSRSLDRIRGVRNTGLVSSPSHFTAASLVLSSSRFG